MFDSTLSGFLINTGKHLVLVDTGCGSWFGGPSFGTFVINLKRAGYSPDQIDFILLTHLHSDHMGGLTTHDGLRVVPNAEVYASKIDADFWLSPEVAAKAPKEAQDFFRSARAIAEPYIKAKKWHTFEGSIEIVDGVRSFPEPGHAPGHTGYRFTSQGQEILFWGTLCMPKEFSWNIRMYLLYLRSRSTSHPPSAASA